MPRGRGILCFAVLLAFAPHVAGAVSFTIEDGLSTDQVAEETHVYIDGVYVGVFRLTASSPDEAIQVTVPDAPQYEYVLCGETTLRMPDGSEETRPVNDSGMLSDADGRSYVAYTRAYSSFFLVDVSAGRPPALLRTHLGPRCPAPISDVPRAPVG
jgi:hypothetical protein